MKLPTLRPQQALARILDLCRFTVAGIWMYQGWVPKLLGPASSSRMAPSGLHRSDGDTLSFCRHLRAALSCGSVQSSHHEYRIHRAVGGGTLGDASTAAVIR